MEVNAIDQERWEQRRKILEPSERLADLVLIDYQMGNGASNEDMERYLETLGRKRAVIELIKALTEDLLPSDRVVVDEDKQMVWRDVFVDEVANRIGVSPIDTKPIRGVDELWVYNGLFEETQRFLIGVLVEELSRDADGY